MCGIFGIVSKQLVVSAQFIELAEANKHRGNLSFGYLTGKLGAEGIETAVSRYLQPFAPDLVELAQANLALGHIRAPTGARSNQLQDVHPFAANATFLAHNGLLLNPQQFPAWRLYPDSDVDSQFILGGIQAYLAQKFTFAAAIQATVSQLEGQQACWLWSQAESAIYLWRVMSPLYCSQTETRFTFSSSRHLSNQMLLPEGVIFRLDPLTLSFTEAAAFSYYSPYKVY